MTRSRQRIELLNLLLDLSYSEKNEVRQQSIETAKELYQIDYIKFVYDLEVLKPYLTYFLTIFHQKMWGNFFLFFAIFFFPKFIINWRN